jgi:hypothetical protein
MDLEETCIQGFLCWRRPAVIKPTHRPTDRPSERNSSESEGSQSRQRVKYGHEPCGTRIQVSLYWRGPAAMFQSVVPRSSCRVTKSRWKGSLTHGKAGTANISLEKFQKKKPVGEHIPNIKMNLTETCRKGVEYTKLANNLVHQAFSV